MDPTDSSTEPLPMFNDFGLQEFLDGDLNFDQVIEMLRGEAPNNDVNNIIINPTLNDGPNGFGTNLLEDDLNQIFPITHQLNNVSNNFNSPSISCTTSSMLNSLSGIDDDMSKGGFEEDEDDDDEDSYWEGERPSLNNSNSTIIGTEMTTTTTTTIPYGNKVKGDRSKTLISERKRRCRMKDQLYALRALVPNITKMDKASIVGDAVLYVQDLQTQAKKLKSEVEDLTLTLKAAERSHDVTNPHKNSASLSHFLPLCKMIIQMDVHQIEEKEFYVKVVSNKGQGVAASLYKSLESFTTFTIQNSNLNTLSERFVLTFTLNVGKCKENMNLASLKIWITGAFLNQGFEFQSFQ